MKIKTNIILYLITILMLSCSIHKRINSTLLQKDVEFLVNKINVIYPFNNIYVDTIIIETAKNKLQNYLLEKDKVTLVEFNNKVSDFLKIFHDKHLKTQLQLKHELNLYYFSKVIDIDIVTRDSKFFVFKSYKSANIIPGDEIIAINNFNLKENFTSESNIGCKKFGDFPYAFWLKTGNLKKGGVIKYVRGNDTLYEKTDLIKYRKYINLSFEYRTEQLNQYIGILESCLFDKDFKSCEKSGIPKYLYGKVKNKDIGILRIDKFQGTANQKYFYKSTFSQIKKDSINNLIIDISENQGGNTNDLVDLLSYLTDKSFTLFNMVIIKKNENSAAMAGCNYLNEMDSACMRIKRTKEGSYLNILNKEDVTFKFNNPLKFEGNIYILISNATFSSASAFAQIIKENRIGKLVGENTGDLTSNYGDPVKVKLPYSKIFVQIPTKLFINNDQTYSYKGVEPDMYFNNYSINNNCNFCLLNELIKIIK